MRIIVELCIIGIALAVFYLQHKRRQKLSIVESKLIYWSTLLFISIGFNGLLFKFFPGHYNVISYWNLPTLLGVFGVLLGYVLLQMIAPSKPLHKVVKRFTKKKSEEDLDAQDEAEHFEAVEKDSYIKEMHFETFLETVCLIAITFTLVLEVMMIVLGEALFSTVLTEALRSLCVAMMMITLPIIMRQIIFYLYTIRGMKQEQSLTELEMQFQHRLKKTHTKL